MKRFLKNLLIFSFIVCSFLILSYLQTNKIVLRKTNYKIPKNIDKLIIGHSHPECAYNDSLICDFINASSSGSSYFYNYYTLKPIIAHNEQIKTIFIEFTNNQIGSIMDDWTFDDIHLPIKLQLGGTYIDKDGLQLLLKKNIGGVLNGFIKLLRQQIYIIFTSNYKYLYNKGGYLYLVRDNVIKELKIHKDLDTIKNEKVQISELNLKYLEKCISICKSKNIKVYLVRSPLHHKYSGLYNEQEFQKQIHTRFKNIEFLDFRKYPLSNTEFGDLEHLNYRGARKFSIWFNLLLENGLLIQKNKQQFINLKI